MLPVKKQTMLLLAMALMMMFTAIVQAAPKSLRKGDRGEAVREVQERLIAWGFLEGNADGVFGSGTEDAVKRYQRRYGLNADGIVGKSTAAHMGVKLTDDGSGQAGSATSTGNAIRRGDRGNTVKTLQQRLSAWGYYSGSVDGIFGASTEEAVKKYQKRYGMKVDGIVGKETAAHMGIQLTGSGGGTSTGGNQGNNNDSGSNTSGSGSGNLNQGDVNLLARAVYGEARGEPYKGQVAIAAVILNRVKHAQFPNSISGVIYQPGAFSIVADGQINLQPDETALRAARDAMNGYDPTSGCVFYYNPNKTSNSFMHGLPTVVTIGQHRFSRGK
ncbi:spore cortex-lytic enzyme [Eubacteriales bacterium OttesenSCG-928-M02]|nr:spore cortex-lytic enzyme [Eubacteriales bacterium OttesenSCG-928-M02]